MKRSLLIFVLLASALTAQTITALVTVTKNVGESATFTAVATGGHPPYSYHWSKLVVLQPGVTSAQIIPGATAATYIIPSVALTDAGQYFCQAGDGSTQATSAPVALAVIAPVAVVVIGK